jgi:hypothetical protein
MNILKWDIVTQPREHGGLGLRKSQSKNKALLTKKIYDHRELKRVVTYFVSILLNKRLISYQK